MALSSLLSIMPMIAGGINAVSGLVSSGAQLANAFKGMSGNGSSWNQSGNVSHGESASTGASGVDYNAAQAMNANLWSQALAGQSAQSAQNAKNSIYAMGLNTLGAIAQGVYNQISQNTAMSYNSAEAQKARDWSEHMSNTAYQRARKDMEAAGINPILAYTQGGASTPSSAQGTISAQSISAPSVGTQSSGMPTPQQPLPGWSKTESWSKTDTSGYSTGGSTQSYGTKWMDIPNGELKTWLSESANSGKKAGQKPDAVSRAAPKKPNVRNDTYERWKERRGDE